MTEGHTEAGFINRLRNFFAIPTALELVCLAIVATILFLAAFGPIIAPTAETPNPAQVLEAPSLSHPLGTDQNGTDILARIVAAPRVDALVALIATALSVLVGVPIGVLAGYFESGGRRVARAGSEGVLRLLDVIQAFPVFILALVLVAIRGPSATNLVIAIAFVNAPVFIRIVRTEIVSLKERQFAEAARADGLGDVRIAFRHLLPNALPQVLVQISVTIGFAIILTAGLSFVGAGVAAPTPELGAMIAAGSKYLITGQWWLSVFPGIALGAMVFSFAICGDLISRLMEPGEKKRRRRRAATEESLPYVLSTNPELKP